MASARQSVWLITGASSSLGYRLCLAVLSQGDLVVATAASQQHLDRLRSAGACTVRMVSEMSFGEIKTKMREAVSFYGRIDVVLNNPESEPLGSQSLYGPYNPYQTNSFSYTAIQVTTAVAQACSIRKIVVIAFDTPSGHTPQPGYPGDLGDNVEAIAQLFSGEYRSRRVGVLLAKPGSLYTALGFRIPVEDTRAVVERIVGKVREGGPSEPGLTMV